MILPGLEEEGVDFAAVKAVGAPSPKHQGGPELWAKLDAIEVSEPLAYPEQPLVQDRDFGL